MDKVRQKSQIIIVHDPLLITAVIIIRRISVLYFCNSKNREVNENIRENVIHG